MIKRISLPRKMDNYLAIIIIVRTFAADNRNV